jgi:hypothetical protein
LGKCGNREHRYCAAHALYPRQEIEAIGHAVARSRDTCHRGESLDHSSVTNKAARGVSLDDLVSEREEFGWQINPGREF